MSASRKKSSSSIKTETNNKPTTKKQDALNKEFVKIFEENGLDKMAKEVGIVNSNGKIPVTRTTDTKTNISLLINIKNYN